MWKIENEAIKVRQEQRRKRRTMSTAELNMERKTVIETKGKRHAKQHRNVKSVRCQTVIAEDKSIL